MKGLIEHLSQDRLIRQSTIVTIIIFLLSLVVIGIGWFRLPPIVPIYNQETWGTSRLAAKFMFFLPLGMCMFFFIVNAILARMSVQSMPLLSRIFFLTSLFCMILIFIFLIKTIQLII